MNKNVFKAFCAVCMGVVMCVACQEKIAQVDDEPQKKVKLSVSVPLPETRTTGSVDESIVKNYQVFVYNVFDNLESYLNADAGEELSLECTEGPKKVVVLVNAPAITQGSTLTSLKNTKAMLKENEDGGLLMEGLVSATITASKPSVSVPVSRMVSKIRLSHLETAFEMPQYQSQTFTVSSVYLINVPADKNYLLPATADQWYNKMKYDPADVCTLIYDDMGDVEVSASSPYETVNTFYCFPNSYTQDSFATTWSGRRTRLVVEARLAGIRYYYPVTLPPLEGNKVYDVSLTITRPGTSTPDAEVDKFAVGFDITIKGWETGASVTEEI